MSEQDGPPVSRRQLFQGLAGNLRRAFAELAAPLADGLEPTSRPQLKVLSKAEGDVMVDPERQEATMSELLGYLSLNKKEEET